MEAHVSSQSFPIEARKPLRTTRRAYGLLLLLFANLAATAGLWFVAFGGIGGFWLATGYDWLVVISGAVMLSQYITLGLWASLCEPRSPFRWFGLLLLAALGAAAMAGAFIPASLLRMASSAWGRWALPWGVVFWEAYTTFMLVLCAGIVLFLAADIVAWPLRRVLGCRLVRGGQVPVTPAARGFGLSEMFWWVGMAAAASWLLRAMLENALSESVAMVMVLLVSVLPAALPAAWSAFGAQHRWKSFLLTLLWAGAYGAGLAGLFWVITSVGRAITNTTLLYLLYIPFEMLPTIAVTSAAVLFINCLGLSKAGVRLFWHLPSGRTAAGKLVS